MSDTLKLERVDILIIGAGPAGSVAAALDEFLLNFTLDMLASAAGREAMTAVRARLTDAAGIARQAEKALTPFLY